MCSVLERSFNWVCLDCIFILSVSFSWLFPSTQLEIRIIHKWKHTLCFCFENMLCSWALHSWSALPYESLFADTQMAMGWINQENILKYQGPSWVLLSFCPQQIAQYESTDWNKHAGKVDIVEHLVSHCSSFHPAWFPFPLVLWPCHSRFSLLFESKGLLQSRNTFIKLTIKWSLLRVRTETYPRNVLHKHSLLLVVSWNKMLDF